MGPLSFQQQLLTQILPLIGVCIGILSGALGGWMNRRAEDRRAIRQLGVEIGRAKFEHNLRFAQQLADATGKVVPVPPIDMHLIHGIRLMEIISDPSLGTDEIVRRISALKDLTDAVAEAAKRN